MLALPAVARDTRATRLAQAGKKLADSVESLWEAFWKNRKAISDEDLQHLIESYEKAADSFAASLEIEERAGLSQSILLLARKARMAIFEQMSRVPKPPPKKSRLPREKPKEASEQEEEEEEEEVEEVAEEAEPVRLPERIETKAQRTRALHNLRRFLLDHGSYRRLENLVDRCGQCNGIGKKRAGYLDKRRRPVMVPCKLCHESGALLNVSAVRHAFWLSNSPLYRSIPLNLQKFELMKEEWYADPRKIPEFIKRVRIAEKKTEYHGFWAKVNYTEEGWIPNPKNTRRPKRFKRTVSRMCIRVGKHWYFYDDKWDKDFFAPPDAPIRDGGD